MAVIPLSMKIQQKMLIFNRAMFKNRALILLETELNKYEFKAFESIPFESEKI